MIASVVVPAEIPGFATDVLRGGPEHRALDRHASVRSVVVPWRKQTFDRKSEEHDPSLLTVEVPSRHVVPGVERRHGSDLEAHVLQFRPGSAEELDRGSDGEIEAVDATVERREGRAYDLAASESTVSPMARSAARRGRGAGATGHSESLGVVPGRRRRGVQA